MPKYGLFLLRSDILQDVLNFRSISTTNIRIKPEGNTFIQLTTNEYKFEVVVLLVLLYLYVI